MSLKDWEETGGKAPVSPEKTAGAPGPPSPGGEPPHGPRFYRQPYGDPVTRRRLLELMAVILIVFAVLYIMIPVFSGTAETSRRVVCASHLRRLVQAAQMYDMDFEGLPPTPVWTRALYPFVLDPGRTGHADPGFQGGLDALFCPSEEANLPRLRRKRVAITSSYTYVNPHDLRFTGDDSTTCLFWDTMGGIGRAAHPGGGNVAYLDGHVSWRPAERWRAGDFP
jgi:prepilin-type processing-associated H-X9-DG protein